MGTSFVEPLEARALLSAALGAADYSAVGAVQPEAAATVRQEVVVRSEPAGTRAAQKFEVRFITRMIDHHHMAVMMGEIAAQKAVHPELRQLGEAIVSAQTQEIQQMQGWLQSWYGVAYEARMKPGEERRMDRMEAMSGEEFEVAFMKQMVRHHWKAILMSRQALRRAEHQELLGTADAIVAAQTQEIRQMQTWLRDWYGIERFGPRV
jgi:uncharacterized protein (DUF305 family)